METEVKKGIKGNKWINKYKGNKMRVRIKIRKDNIWIKESKIREIIIKEIGIIIMVKSRINNDKIKCK